MTGSLIWALFSDSLAMPIWRQHISKRGFLYTSKSFFLQWMWSLLSLLGGETTPCKTPHFQWIYGKWKMLDDILIKQHSCYSKSAQTLSVLFSGLLFFLPVLYASTFFAFCCKNWLKGWCNMLVNGISRYFEANFEVSLLCYVFVWTFHLCYFVYTFYNYVNQSNIIQVSATSAH